MPRSARIALALLAFLTAPAVAVRAQGPLFDRPQPFTPVHPESREELNRAEAVKLYGLGTFHEHNNRLLAAVHAYEEASRLDPEAAPPYKALVPLYLGLDRLDDALTACKKAVDLDPGDYETWHLYARQLRLHDRSKDAADALARALACPGLKEHPELHVQIAFDLAVMEESLSDWSKAEAAYLDVVKVLDNAAALELDGDLNPKEIDGQAAETLERLGRLALRTNQSDRARDYFQKAHDRIKATDAARARRLAYNLAELDMAREDWAAALKTLDEYLDALPQGTEAYRAKIKVLQKLGRGGEVVRVMEAYALRDAQNSGLKLLYAEQLGMAGFADAAERIYKEMAQSTAAPEVYRGLFQLYAGTKPPQFDRLVTLLDENLGAAAGKKDDDQGDVNAAARARAMLVVLRQDPALVKGIMPVVREQLTRHVPINSSTCYFLGVLAARTNQLGEAEQIFRQALLNNQPAARLVQTEADVYSNLLRVLRLAHKNEAIVELCRDGLQRARGTAPFFFHLSEAQALARLGKLADALKEADAAIAAANTDPNRLVCRETRVRILMQAQHYDQAADECNDLLKDYNNPEEVRGIRHTLSVVYSAARLYDKAEEQLRLLLEADPNDATANNDLGYEWADRGKNLEEAEKLIRKALDLDRKQRLTGTPLDPEAEEDNAAYTDSLGWVLFRRGHHEAARKELEKAVALPDGADDPLVWDHLADVCLRLGDRARAKAALVKAVELYEGGGERLPDDHYKEIKQKLKQLERK